MQQTYPDESSGDGVRKLVPAAREGRFRDTTLVSLSRVQQTVSCPARARGSSLRRCDALRTAERAPRKWPGFKRGRGVMLVKGGTDGVCN